jgi:transposase
MTGEMFKAYTEQFLVPTLKRGDIVFMDNVSVHKVDGIEEAIEARGAIPFYLPAYSPDLNPIEQLFAKLKALLRKVAAYTLKNAAFTVRSLCKAVASCLDQISRAELRRVPRKFRIWSTQTENALGARSNAFREGQ